MEAGGFIRETHPNNELVFENNYILMGDSFWGISRVVGHVEIDAGMGCNVSVSDKLVWEDNRLYPVSRPVGPRYTTCLIG